MYRDTLMDNQQALDCAYIAGLLDGEGSFCMKRNGHTGSHVNVRYTPDISFGITNQAVADRYRFFLNKYDIAFYEQKRIFQEPYLPLYAFNVRRLVHVRKTLLLLIPHLVGKKRQAELMLKFCESRMDSEGNVLYRGGTGKGAYPQWIHDLWLEMRVLNGKGKPKGDPNTKRAAQLKSLNDCMLSVQIQHKPVAEMTKDTVSPAYERCSTSPEVAETNNR